MYKIGILRQGPKIKILQSVSLKIGILRAGVCVCFSLLEPLRIPVLSGRLEGFNFLYLDRQRDAKEAAKYFATIIQELFLSRN